MEAASQNLRFCWISRERRSNQKQVAYQLGFSCPAAFYRVFAAFLGATPRDYVSLKPGKPQSGF